MLKNFTKLKSVEHRKFYDRSKKDLTSEKMTTKYTSDDLAAYVQKSNLDMFVVLEEMSKIQCTTNFYFIATYDELYKFFNVKYPSIQELPVTNAPIIVYEPVYDNSNMKIKIKARHGSGREANYSLYNKQAYDYAKKVLDRNLGNLQEWDKLYDESWAKVPSQQYGSFAQFVLPTIAKK